MRKFIRILCTVLTVVIAFSSVSALAAQDYVGEDYVKGNSKGNNSANVSFYIQINGEQLDTNGNISGRNSKFYTGVIDKSGLKNSLSANYSIAIGNRGCKACRCKTFRA